MESFYKEMIAEIDTFIQSNRYQEAIKKIEDELSLPYIPLEVEKALRERLENISVEDDIKPIYFDDETLEKMLKGNEQDAMIAIDYLNQMNIQKNLDLIQDVFNIQKSRVIVVSLIDALRKQNVTREFQCEIDGLEISFMPCFVEDPFYNDGVDIAQSLLSTWFEHDNASFYHMCIESLLLESYLHLPFTIEEDEAEALALAICKYVFEAFGQKEEYFMFLEQKKLASLDGFELLLKEHDNC